MNGETTSEVLEEKNEQTDKKRKHPKTLANTSTGIKDPAIKSAPVVSTSVKLPLNSVTGYM